MGNLTGLEGVGTLGMQKDEQTEIQPVTMTEVTEFTNRVSTP